MSILPINQPKIADKTPTKFLIWGPSMSGKTYLARQFPNPLILNTDGNGKKVETPSIDIQDFEHFMNVIGALEKEKHTYETIIIDLIDDIETMLTSRICAQYGVETIGEIKWGKGWAEQMQKWKNLMVRLANMKMNVIFISHFIEKSDDDKVNMTPSLPVKFLNMCMGRCDLGIKTTKMGNRYIRTVTERREAYTEDVVKDPVILEILKDVIGVFEKPSIQSKPNAGSKPIAAVSINQNKNDILPQNNGSANQTGGKPELKRVDLNALNANKDTKNENKAGNKTENETNDISEEKINVTGTTRDAIKDEVQGMQETEETHLDSLDDLETLEDDLNNL